MKQGGYRKGAGRPVGTTKYGEPTKVMRVPVSKISIIEDLLRGWRKPKR